MCQTEKDKLPEKEEGEPQKKEASPNNTEPSRTKGKRIIKLYDPSEYYV